MWCGGGGGRCGVGASMGAFAAGVYAGDGGVGSGYVNAGRAKLFILLNNSRTKREFSKFTISYRLIPSPLIPSPLTTTNFLLVQSSPAPS